MHKQEGNEPSDERWSYGKFSCLFQTCRLLRSLNYQVQARKKRRSFPINSLLNVIITEVVRTEYSIQVIKPYLEISPCNLKYSDEIYEAYSSGFIQFSFKILTRLKISNENQSINHFIIKSTENHFVLHNLHPRRSSTYCATLVSSPRKKT